MLRECVSSVSVSTLEEDLQVERADKKYRVLKCISWPCDLSSLVSWHHPVGAYDSRP